ncbi:MAG TPA: hypothetical protein VHZ50_15660, partial [Puia sp.]|nr:hypothetical protein [Puia sp.]
MKTPGCLILLFTCLVISCKHSNEPNNKRTLDELVKRYPALYGHGAIDQFKLVRKFYNIEDSVEMQLMETEHGYDKIIIISNETGQTYAIPFPGAGSESYWKFYGEKTNASKDKTFNAEINKAFKTVLKEGGRRRMFFNDIMVSLLQFRPIVPADSSEMKNTLENSPIKDSCKVIAKNNFQAMFHDNELKEYFRFITYYGESGSFFQFEDGKQYPDETDFQIIIY